jgi:hypothetical protein
MFSERYAHYRQSGSGNNWALGFLNYNQKEQEAAHCRIQSMLENLDYFEGF